MRMSPATAGPVRDRPSDHRNQSPEVQERLREEARLRYHARKARDPEGVRRGAAAASRRQKAKLKRERAARFKLVVVRWEPARKKPARKSPRRPPASAEERVQENREKVRRWAQEHPEAVREKAQRRRVRAGRKLDLPFLGVLRSDPCAYCSAPGGTLDHIVPLAAGGEHDEGNLTGACRCCNSGKCATTLLTFLLRKTEVAPTIY